MKKGMKFELIKGDCLVEMRKIPDKSIDAIICDLPYGTTACKWDNIIPFEPLWEQYKRVIKDNGAIVLFGNEPFSSILRLSNFEMYKYDWKWDKVRGSNFATVKIRPFNSFEDIMVFYKKQPTYNPQMEEGKPYTQKQGYVGEAKQTGLHRKEVITVNNGERYPLSIIRFPKEQGFHPTQKPIPLLEYLIKTYTNEKVKCDFCGGSGEIESLTIDCDVQTCTNCKGEGVINSVILDNTFGSGTTCIAAKQLNRSFIGMEMDEKYFEIAVKRINEAQPHVSLFSDCP